MENTHEATANPLSKYFRQPAIFIKLPSNGKHWPEGSIVLPMNGEIPVYPMTTRDEITLRTPDALMNGAGVVDVIQSCCPNIKDPWKIPNVDIDSILIAIRIASYGSTMEVETTCPKCSTVGTHNLDLQAALASVRAPNYSVPLEVKELKIKFCSLPYFGANRAGAIEFEEQKLMQALSKADIDEETRSREVFNSMQRLIAISVESLAASTEYIELDNGIKVTEKSYIQEYYTKADGATVKQIQQKLMEINSAGGIKSQDVTCNACENVFSVPIMFDYSAFFGQGF